MPVITPASTEGRVAGCDHQHYFGAIPSLATAQEIARTNDIVIANNFGTYEDDMFAITIPNVRPHGPLLGFYGKSVQAYTSELPLPEEFHAHNSLGQRINIFSTGIWLMQADHPSPAFFNDPRGFSVNTFRDYRAHEKWATVTADNNKFATDPICVAYLDSMSAFVAANSTVGNPGPPIRWQQTTQGGVGSAFGTNEFNAISYTIGDATQSLRPAPGYWVMGNGLRSGTAYLGTGGYASPNGLTADFPQHVDIAIAENFMQNNGAPWNSWRSEADICADVDMMAHVQLVVGTKISCIVNIFNTTANKNLTNPNLTAAQISQRLRYSVGIYMLGNRGESYFTFVKTTAGGADPGTWTDPYLKINMGAAIDNLTPASAYKDTSGLGNGIYRRDFAGGTVFVNMTANTISFTADAGLKNLDGTAASTGQSLQGHDALVLLTTSTPPPPPPPSDYTNVLTDSYTRVVAAGGLGVADTGQSYTIQGTATNYQVDGASAKVAVPVNAGRRAMPDNVNTLNTRTNAEFSFNELPVGDSQIFYIWVRQNTAGDTGYRLRCELTTGNQILYRMQKVVANVVTSIAVLQTWPGTYTAGLRMKAALQAFDTLPTTMSMKLWPSASAEPGQWQDEVADSQAELQVANNGAWSMFTQALNTNAPANVNVWDFTIDEYVPIIPPPPPPPPTTGNATLSMALRLRNGRNKEQEAEFVESEISPGKVPMVRIFNSMQSWTGAAVEEQQLDAAGRTMIMSFGAGSGVPYASYASGAKDANITAVGNGLKNFGNRIIVCFQHEPENNNVGFQAADYCAAYKYIINAWNSMGVINAEYAAIFQGFTYNTGSSHYNDLNNNIYVDSTLDALLTWWGTDAYNWYTRDGTWKSFATVFQPSQTWLAAHKAGKKWMIAEVGTEPDPADATRKGQWILDMLAKLQTAGWDKFEVVSYFNGQDQNSTPPYQWYFDYDPNLDPNSITAMTSLATDPWFAPVSQPPPSGIQLSISAPNDGDVFQAGVNNTAVVIAKAQATSTDGIQKVTIKINGGTEQTLTYDSVSATYSKSLSLAPGTYSILFTAYDLIGGTKTITPNIAVDAYVAPPPPPPPPIPTTLGGTPQVVVPYEEFVVVLLDHNGREFGELKGSDLRFGKYIKGDYFFSASPNKRNPLTDPGILEAHAVDYIVRRNGKDMAGGEITDVDRDTDVELVNIAGHGWKTYIEGLTLPFDPSTYSDAQNFHSGVPNDRTDDITTVVESLAQKVLNGYDNTIDLSMANILTGVQIVAHFLAADQQNLRDMIDSLANSIPGFEWEITPSQQLVLYSPKKGGRSQLVLDNSNIKGVHFSEQGIIGNILYGRGAGASTSQLQFVARNPMSQARYRDRVTLLDYGDVATKSQLRSMTQQGIQDTARQSLEFWVTVYTKGQDFWSMATDGDDIRVIWNDEDIVLDDWFRCHGYETYVNANGDVEITYHFDSSLDSSDG